MRRFATQPLPPNKIRLRKLRRFVDRWLEKNLVPLDPDTDFSVETWLSKTNYPEKRRQELLEIYNRIIEHGDKQFWRVKSFIKEETYPEYKDLRPINSRTDQFKTIIGPFFKAIEEVVFKNDHFIKKIPVPDRPRFIMDKLYSPEAKYVASDYTSFEAHFTKEIMQHIEFRLYKYMMSKCPNKLFYHLIENAIGGINDVNFKDFWVEIEAIRMSGEMCTSLGNGFTNLMLMLFVLEEAGCTDIDGVVEGDDGLFRFKGPAPTTQQFADLGWNIKLDYHDEISTASFCGLVFDIEDLKNVTDIREVLINFGWTSRQYILASKSTHLDLLRAKGYSLAYAYQGCPVLSALARYALRVTRGRDITNYVKNSRNLGWWEREWLLQAIKTTPEVANTPVGIRTRLLVEERYGVRIEDQLALEKYLDGLTKLQPLSHPSLSILSAVSAHYFHHYVRQVRVGDMMWRQDVSEVASSSVLDKDDFLIFNSPSPFSGEKKKGYLEWIPAGVVSR